MKITEIKKDIRRKPILKIYNQIVAIKYQYMFPVQIRYMRLNGIIITQM